MKDITKQLGYPLKPTHNYNLMATAFPPIVNPNYLEMWAEFICLQSVTDLYSKYKDNKVALSMTALTFINYLTLSRVPSIFVKQSVDPFKITYACLQAEIMPEVEELTKYLRNKQFMQHFLISDVKLIPRFLRNGLLGLQIPDKFSLNIGLVPKENLFSAWKTYPAGYWPEMPKQMNVNFRAFTLKHGLLSFGEYKAAIITGDVLAIRHDFKPSSIVCATGLGDTLSRKLNLAIKGKL